MRSEDFKCQMCNGVFHKLSSTACRPELIPSMPLNTLSFTLHTKFDLSKFIVFADKNLNVT